MCRTGQDDRSTDAAAVVGYSGRAAQTRLLRHGVLSKTEAPHGCETTSVTMYLRVTLPRNLLLLLIIGSKHLETTFELINVAVKNVEARLKILNPHQTLLSVNRRQSCSRVIGGGRSRVGSVRTRTLGDDKMCKRVEVAYLRCTMPT